MNNSVDLAVPLKWLLEVQLFQIVKMNALLSILQSPQVGRLALQGDDLMAIGK